MYKRYRNELLCDFAETYHIFQMEGLPARMCATLFCGLRESSRVKLKLAHRKVPFETELMAACYDMLHLLVYSKTKDASKGRNKPQMLVNKLIDLDKEETIMAFSSPDEFMKAWNEDNEKR